MASPTDLLATLAQGEPGPLYFIYGKERFLVERAVEILRERVLDPRTRDFNCEIFFGKEARPLTITQAARTLPMMAKRRLVLVRDVDEMKAELSELATYVANPAPESCLVLVAEKVDQRLKFFSAFKKRGVLIKCEPLYERQLPQFVRDEAKRRGANLAAGVAEAVVHEVGTELGLLSDAIERLRLFAGERPVTLEDVKQAIVSSRQHTVFELCNAVGARDRARSLHALGTLLSAREAGVRLVAMLTRHIRQLWLARELSGKNVDLAAELGIPPFFVRDIAEQAKNFHRRDFAAMHEALFFADRALKSSKLEEARILEQLVLKLVPEKAASYALI